MKDTTCTEEKDGFPQLNIMKNHCNLKIKVSSQNEIKQKAQVEHKRELHLNTGMILKSSQVVTNLFKNIV